MTDLGKQVDSIFFDIWLKMLVVMSPTIVAAFALFLIT